MHSKFQAHAGHSKNQGVGGLSIFPINWFHPLWPQQKKKKKKKTGYNLPYDSQNEIPPKYCQHMHVFRQIQNGN